MHQIPDASPHSQSYIKVCHVTDPQRSAHARELMARSCQSMSIKTPALGFVFTCHVVIDPQLSGTPIDQDFRRAEGCEIAHDLITLVEAPAVLLCENVTGRRLDDDSISLAALALTYDNFSLLEGQS